MGDIEGINIQSMASEIKKLRHKIETLEQQNSDLEIALTTAVEHGDAIESELFSTNDRLRGEVRERVIAERRLSKVLTVVSQQKDDLEVLVQTITEHSDEIDTQWLSRYSEVEALARLDPLTSIANRRMLDSALEQEWTRSLRSGSPLSVAMCDLDLFKAYNDRYGHNRGDQVLIAFAEILRGCSRRPPDLPARVGGEEFLILFPETDLAGARQVAEAIRLALWTLAIPHADSPHGRVTVSIGLACVFPRPEGDPADLIAQADFRLYEAKAHNRNTVRA
ncbi:diguanylate cyclase [Rhodospirillum rubrum F11]|uniref:diguanylate cyclase n=2 Tax=Rhodospirillum rubrum TaxID=1085 RepID=Q2RY88_RHORT|nr:Putative diguanylate cyclase (GGDEF domain) [Rhodospirillum rubrum ATCC 11170]AEO46574.1 diguanylate cyclase [Rhodospirillum rubrum F11]MBK5952465.1 GGDEF domain-containing protein [Rhodospirillum rubrum]QXG80606.1 diguanylate cyclase [Rhodospirillum rubrum]